LTKEEKKAMEEEIDRKEDLEVKSRFDNAITRAKFLCKLQSPNKTLFKNEKQAEKFLDMQKKISEKKEGEII
jgi:hypothetical protein